MEFSALIQQGSGNAWLFFPTAIFLGALHGLEPGHSKTMIAAFIIAVRGTIPQAILLGLSAAFSHVIIVWVLAMAALSWGDELIAEHSEPYLIVASGIIIILMALWMARRGWLDLRAANAVHAPHDHGHKHDHSETAHATHDHGHKHDHSETAHATHDHGHNHPKQEDFTSQKEYMDAHQKMHQQDIQKRFSNQTITTGQIILFGLTGGLIPCTASVAVLLICIQLKEWALGMAMVGAFSIGLAMAMVGVGMAAAWGVAHASNRFKEFDKMARRLPLLSSSLIFLVGVFMLVNGWNHLPG